MKTHLLRAFAKLGVDDRTAAVTVAMQLGLLTQPWSMTPAARTVDLILGQGVRPG